jgi:hypothetical protein
LFVILVSFSLELSCACASNVSPLFDASL